MHAKIKCQYVYTCISNVTIHIRMGRSSPVDLKRKRKTVRNPESATTESDEGNTDGGWEARAVTFGSARRSSSAQNADSVKIKHRGSNKICNKNIKTN